MKVRTGDCIILGDGGREKAFVILGFAKHHVCVADAKAYNHSMAKHGTYCKMEYGCTSFPIQTSGVQRGFWSLLKSVNGKQLA